MFNLAYNVDRNININREPSVMYIRYLTSFFVIFDLLADSRPTIHR